MLSLYVMIFQTGWFLECLWSQSLVMLVLRSQKLPIIQSRPSKIVTIITLLSCILTNIIPYTLIGTFFKFAPISFQFYIYLFVILFLYIVAGTIVKHIYINNYKQWL